MAGLLQGKVTLVTGAGGGIGRATALVLAHEGARVLVSDISTRRGTETAELVRAAGGEAEFLKADVSRAADCEALVVAAVQHWAVSTAPTTTLASPAKSSASPRTPKRIGTARFPSTLKAYGSA